MASAPHVWEEAYLAAFGMTGHVEMSARAAGIDSSTVRRARGRKSFAEREAAARHRAIASLTLEAHRRAVTGWEEPVYGLVHGATEQVGTITRFDSGLLQFLLKGLAPETFSDRLRLQGTLGVVEAQIGVKDDPALLEQAAAFLAAAVGRRDGDGGQELSGGTGDPGEQRALPPG